MIKLFVLIFLIPVLCYAVDELSETDKKELEKMKTMIYENMDLEFKKSLKQQEIKSNALAEKAFNCQKKVFLAQIKMRDAKNDADKKSIEAEIKILNQCSAQLQKENMAANIKELESALVNTKKNSEK